MFRVKTSAFEKKVRSILRAIHDVLRERLMDKYEEKYKITHMVERKKLFLNYLFARYATDVRCQQANRLSCMSFDECQIYHSAEHKL